MLISPNFSKLFSLTISYTVGLGVQEVKYKGLIEALLGIRRRK